MTTVTIYTSPACPQCTLTKRALDDAGVPYTPVDLSQDETAYKYVTEELGYKQAPVVVNGNDHWSGLNPDKINTLSANK